MVIDTAALFPGDEIFSWLVFSFLLSTYSIEFSLERAVFKSDFVGEMELDDWDSNETEKRKVI